MSLDDDGNGNFTLNLTGGGSGSFTLPFAGTNAALNLRNTSASASASLISGLNASSQNVTLQKAVVAPSGGTSSDGITTMSYTLGQPVVGTASNTQTTGTFGFWSDQFQVSSVTGTLGAGAITSMSVAPSPLLSTGRVKLTIASAGMLDVGLYNAAGERVLELFRGEREAGVVTLSIATEDLASGAYFIAARTPGAILQVPVTVTK